MTRSELILSLASRFPQLSVKDAEVAVKKIIDSLSQTLARGNRVEVRGFSSFGLNYRPPRTGRNPKTAEKVAVVAKYVPYFKAGMAMLEPVNRHQD